MALDIFNLATQSFVGGALNAGQGAVNNLASSAIGALGGTLMGGRASGGLITGTGMIPDFPCGMGSSGCSGFGSGIGSLNDPCGRFNDPFNNAFESLALQGVSGAIGAIGELGVGGGLSRFGNALSGVGNGLLNTGLNTATNLGVGIMGNLGVAAAGSLISTVGNASLSDAGRWLDSASDAISDWF